MLVVHMNPPSYPKQPIITDLSKLIIFYCHHFVSNSFFILIEKTAKQHIINPCRTSLLKNSTYKMSFFVAASVIQCVTHIAQAL